MEQNNKKELLYYPVPRPSAAQGGDVQPPAMMSYVIRMQDTSPEGEALDLLYFYIGRDRTVPLTSFTVTYRFSALPIMLDDPDHPFYTYTYTDDDINEGGSYIVCKFTLPPERAQEFPGCTAYVSEIVTTSGERTVIDPKTLSYTDEDMEKLSDAMSLYYEGTTRKEDISPTQSDEEETYNALLEAENEKARQSKKVRLWTRTAGYTLLALCLALGIWCISAYLSYQKAMIGAEVYLEAGEYMQAQEYVNETCSKNVFYLSRKKEMTKTVSSLLTASRYNEAFKIATLIPDTELLQKVCTEASADALANKKYTDAYVYAQGAPNPFGEEIIEEAIRVVLDPYAESFDEGAYLVARKTKDEKTQNEILLKLISYACGKYDYPVAMEAALAITDEDTHAASVADIFGIATQYYIKREEFQMAADFITRYAEGNEIADDVREALISYFSESSNTSSAFFLSKHFGIDATHINVSAEDSAVSADLGGIYPLLTEAQMRAYHARRVAVAGLTFVLGDDGAVVLVSKSSGAKPSSGDPTAKNAQAYIDTLLSDKDVVSIAANDLCVACLISDGTVVMFPTRIAGGQSTKTTPLEEKLISDAKAKKNVISVVAGGEHFVYLHADGTVSASGDNTSGQCDTKKWKDIASVAAGEDFTVALKTDGTLLACGDGGAGQCDVASLPNVTAIAACDRTTVALFSDGTVGIIGERSMGLSDISMLSRVKRIRAGGSAIIAETSDGTYHICGSGAASGNYGSTASWNHIIDYDVGALSAAALQKDGNVRATGTNRPKQ